MDDQQPLPRIAGQQGRKKFHELPVAYLWANESWGCPVSGRDCAIHVALGMVTSPVGTSGTSSRKPTWAVRVGDDGPSPHRQRASAMPPPASPSAAPPMLRHRQLAPSAFAPNDGGAGRRNPKAYSNCRARPGNTPLQMPVIHLYRFEWEYCRDGRGSCCTPWDFAADAPPSFAGEG